MPDKDQVTIFNSGQLELIKNTFDNDTLIYTIRKVFLQFPLSEVEKGLLKTTINPEVWNVLKTMILPDQGPQYPLAQYPDFLKTLYEGVRTKSVEDMAVQFDAIQLEMDYLQQQLEVLRDLEAPQPITLAEMRTLKGKAALDKFIDVTVYLRVINYIPYVLTQLRTHAKENNLTPDEIKKRQDKNSSQ